MLDWLSSRLRKDKDIHPFQTNKGIDEALQSLPANQPLIVLDEIGQWLAEAEQLKTALEPRALANAIRRLDEHARDALREAWFRLLAEIATEGLREDAWLALSAYYGHAAGAYRIAGEALAQTGKPSDADKNNQALLALRAFRALADQKKMLRMRYRYPEAALWKQLHALFASCRKQAIGHLISKAYPDEEPATPLSEYLCALALETAPLENLAPQQIACIDLIVRKHRKDLVFREEPGDTTPFCVDTEGETGPFRLQGGAPRPAGGRYFGVGGLPGHIFNLSRTLLKTGAVPEWLVDTGCTKEDLLTIGKILGDHWSAQPPKRRHSRRQAEAAIKVVHGFAQARRMVAASSYARSGRKVSYSDYAEMMRSHHEARFGRVDGEMPRSPPAAEEPQSRRDVQLKLELVGDRQLMEEWLLLDISETGMGAIVPHHRKWLSIGVLVGFRPEENLDWRIGIVRRLGRGSQGRRQAGLEVFSGTPVPAQYRLGDEAQKPGGPSMGAPGVMDVAARDAILVSRERRTLLIEPQHFEQGQPFSLIVEGTSTFHRFGKLLESGKDYRYVEFDDIGVPPEG